MPIFLKVESSSVKGRLFHTATIVALSIGGFTMIYPFLLMISGAFRSELDENDLDLVPAFFVREEVLYQKFLEFKYQQEIGDYNRAHMRRDFAFRFVDAPTDVSSRAVEDFRRFFEEEALPRHWQVLGGVFGTRTVPENLRELRRRLAASYDGDIERFSRDVGTSVASWTQVVFPRVEWMSYRFDLEDNILSREYYGLLEEAPFAKRQLVSLSGFFLELVVYPNYGNVETVNREFGLELASMSEFRLPQTVPGTGRPGTDQFRQEWIDFILQDLNTSFVVLAEEYREPFQQYLREQYEDQIGDLNVVWGEAFDGFEAVELPQGRYLSGGARTDYNEFLATIDPEAWSLVGPEYAWRDWLIQEFEGDIAALNAAYGRNYGGFDEIWMPFAELELTYARENSGSLRRTFAARNFINVFDAVFVEGRIFINTVIYCSLAVLFALLVNPLAAYALSRFQIPGTYKILLLMMAVMAFPPMVTTIPVFIMMQNFGLMNTFAGLLLPTIANGYLIYLLKGFFDSLPRELYEAAQIEGASEFRMFFSITMALSKPILAVVGLTAFNAAYTVFLFALIIAPEQDMWLLSVWLYQYRATVSTGGVFASVLVASIPPILVFLFAQNIILRGIVVPVEK